MSLYDDLPEDSKIAVEGIMNLYAAKPITKMTGEAIKASIPKQIPKYLFDKLPEKLYASAVKLPLSKKWTEALPGKDINKRKLAVREGIQSRIPPSEFGVQKAKFLEKDVREYIDETLKVFDDYPDKDVNIDDVIKNGLDRAYYKAERSSNPIKSIEIVDQIADAYKQHGGPVSLSRANELKRQLYEEVKYMRDAPDPLVETSKKGIAHELMVGIEKQYPDIKSLNQTDQARIYLIDALERSVGRIENTNMIPLGAKVLTRPHTWPLAIFDATVGHPQIKARIAFALAKANPKKYSKFIYPEMPKGYIAPAVIPEEGIYRYVPPKIKTEKWRPGEIKTTLHPAEIPPEIKTKMQIAKELEDYQRLKSLENTFIKQAYGESKRGPDLIKPKTKLSKSARPMSVEDRLKNLK